MKRVWMLGVMAVASIFALAACSSGISQEEAAAKDRQIADLQAQVPQLQGQVGGLQQDSKYWTQLTAFLPPVEMPSMSDHRAYMLPSGMVVALHFDNMDLSKAENLNWVASACRERSAKPTKSALRPSSVMGSRTSTT
jgi:hypothetical protein